MFIVLIDHPTHKPKLIEFRGTTLRFERCEVDGERKLAARLPDGVPLLAEIRHMVNTSPRMKMVEDKHVTSMRVAPKGEAPALTGTPVQNTSVMAIGMGWSFADLVGTGDDGNPGEAGGRSPRTGLTLSEMALSAPPADWADAAETAYPWQLNGFTMQMPDWHPPSVTAKVPPTPVEPPPDPGAPYMGDLDLTPPDAAPPASDLGESIATPDDAPEASDGDASAAEGVDPALALDYPAEHIHAARAIAQGVAKKRGTTTLHPNAVNFFLKEADLPTVDTKQLAALLAISV